mmetsp:Transcript_3967/g.5898  ORF Transcript_3967/g.5898 Transcript_3967/m.5898 type:complete len:126 (+) Transcript_3967:479-856(+)
MVAPVVHYWYGVLMVHFPAQTMKAAIQRTLYDQVFFAPIFIPSFMSSLMVLQGDTCAEIVPTIQRQYKDLIVTNWIMWIPAQLINFRVVPLRFQVLFSNIVSLLWNAYFSFKVNNNATKERSEVQ